MTDAIELEAKFAADDATLAQLAAMDCFANFTLIEREAASQDDTYYDTSGQRLRQAGASLRIRRKPAGARMTFKGARQSDSGSHLVSRLEDEVDLDSESVEHLDGHSSLDFRDVPGPLIRARDLAGDAPLVPIARLVTDRTTLLFADGRGTRVEVSVDRCRATRLSDDRIVEFSDVELELKYGEYDDLLAASYALQQVLPGLIPSLATKLQRALE